LKLPNAELQILPTVDETDIKLAFLAARIEAIFALCLHGPGAVTAEWREVLAAAVDVEIARAARAIGRSDVQAQERELLVAALRFIHCALRFVVRNGRGLLRAERLGQAGHLIAKRIVLVAQVVHLAPKLVVFALQVLQLGKNVVQLVQFLEDLIATVFLRLGQIVELGQ